MVALRGSYRHQSIIASNRTRQSKLWLNAAVLEVALACRLPRCRGTLAGRSDAADVTLLKAAEAWSAACVWLGQYPSMTSGKNRERAAAKLIRSNVGAVKAVLTDDGSTPGVHDFDLVFKDAHREPLEITSSVLPMLKSAQAAHEKYKKLIVTVPGLAGAWHVFSSQSTQFKDLDAKALLPFLRGLESAGLTKIHYPMDHHQAPALHIFARQLGIEAAFAMGGLAGKVLVSMPEDHRVWSSDHSDPGRHVLADIEKIAALRDNRRKLSGFPKSHLFVWIDENNYLPWRDIFSGEIPSRKPNLPPEISDVWVATRLPGSVSGWHFSQQDGWRAF